jgi:hypothetical protein
MSQEPSKEIKAVVDSVLGAFNSKNSKLFNDSFAGEVAIIDGFAPFRWIGPNAQARWWADAERWGKQLGVASERISVEKTLHWQMVGTRAYTVLSATLTIGLKKGESIIRPGILIYTLVELNGEWKAESQTWGRQN